MINYIKQAGPLLRKNKRLVFFYFTLSLLLSLIVVEPLRSFLKEYLGSSMMSARLESGLDMDFLTEFLFHSPAFLYVFFPLFFITLIAYMLLNLLFSAGTISLFLQDKGYDSAFFWGNAGRYFWRFFRITLWSLLLLLILFGLSFLLESLRTVWYGKDPYRDIIHTWAVSRIVLRFLILGFVYMVMDYARILTVQQDETRMYRVVFSAIVFVLRNFIRTVPIALIYSLSGLLFLFAYQYISPPILYKAGGVTVLLVFLLQQIVILLRMFLKVSLYASETLLFKDRHAFAIKKKYLKDLSLKPVVPPAL
ncbi:MAG: hypothetical protein H6696_15800 [Deferribacteres bacterium]|nr:hypothetical protein [candidate division KSB1 bacterium]MCB9503394.1 hypothetical protein [Deferribacteres bacterium]